MEVMARFGGTGEGGTDAEAYISTQQAQHDAGMRLEFWKSSILNINSRIRNFHPLLY